MSSFLNGTLTIIKKKKAIGFEITYSFFLLINGRGLNSWKYLQFLLIFCFIRFLTIFFRKHL